MSHLPFWPTVLGYFLVCSPICLVAAEKASTAGDKLFGTAKVVQFHLSFTEKDFAALNPSGRGGFGPPGFGIQRRPGVDAHRNTFGTELPWSKGEVTFDGQTFKDVGIRYKGNYTYLASARSLKKSLKIDINRHIDGQKLDGLTMLNFHNGVSDPTKSRESLTYAVFRELGIPASRTVIAELILTVPGKYDKEYVGVYTLVEQVNKAFLKRHFKDSKGMLLKPEGLHGGLMYLGTTWKAYEERYKPDSAPTDEQKKRLIDFTRLINNGTDEEFAKEIGNYLDVEAFLKFIAANALLSNMDSFLGYGHNYYLYLVPATNKFVFIPWDVDLALATWPAAGMPEQQVNLSIHHPHAGQNKLIDRLFAIKEHKNRYLAIIKEMMDSSFTKKKLLEQLERIEQALKDPMAKETKAVAARKETGSAGGGHGPNGGFGGGFGGAGQFGQSIPPRRFIEKRIPSVVAQLAGEMKGYEPRSIVGGPGVGGFAGPGAGGFGPLGGGFGPPKKKNP